MSQSRRLSVRVLPAALAVSALVLAPAGASAQDKKKGTGEVETCSMPYGTIAINEPHEESMIWLRTYQLGSPSSLLRTFAQKSNCFVVVERGVGMQNINQERQLGNSGELQSGQNFGKGQIVAADYMMTPAIQSSNTNAGGVGGGLGARIPKIGGIVGGGGLKFKEATTSITVASARTSVQVAANEGSARQRDFGVGGVFGVGGLLGGAGAYSNTAEGKVIASSLLDNFNAVVNDIKSSGNLKPMTADRLAKLQSGESTAEGGGGSSANAGDVMVPKIAGVKLMKTASDTAAVVGTLQRGEEVVYAGQESNGFFKVDGAAGEGWVKKTLMTVRR